VLGELPPAGVIAVPPLVALAPAVPGEGAGGSSFVAQPPYAL